MGYLRGRGLKVNGLNLETNCTLNLNAQTEDASTKDDTEGWDNNVITSRSWGVNVDAYVQNSGSNAETLLKAWIDQTDDNAPSVTVNVGSGASVVGTAILQQIDIDATVGQNVSMSLNYQGVGAFT